MTSPAPVVRTVSLRCSRDRAFDVFTRGIERWWPPGFTASAGNLAAVVVEDRVGGRVYEADAGGDEYDWGAVTAWVPNRRVTLSWTLGVAGPPTELDVLFTDNSDGCDVRLEHRGWSPEQAAERAKFDDPGGWDTVLAAYRQHVEA